MAKSAAQPDRNVPDRSVPDGKDAVILVGPPSGVHGHVTLSHTGTKRHTARRGRVNRLGDLVTPATALDCRVVSRRAQPGAVFTTDVFVQLPPSTPPGEFDAEIEINDVSIAATVIVSEVVELEIVPARLVLENRPGDPAVKRVAIRNTGNVPLTVGEIGPVVLDDELLDCRTLRGALQELQGEDVSIEQVLGSIAHHAGAALERAGILRVHNTSGTQTIDPGRTKTLNLEIRLPEHLDRHTRYFGEARIYTENLSFQIVPGPSAR